MIERGKGRLANLFPPNQSHLFHVFHLPNITAQEMSSSCWLFVVKAKAIGEGENVGRFIECVCLCKQTTTSPPYLKEKAHTCVVYASKYNGNFITNFCRLSLQSFQAIQLAEFSFGIKKNQWNLSSQQLHPKFIYFVLLFTFLLAAFPSLLLHLLNFKWMNTQEGSDPTYFLSAPSIAVQALRFFNFLFTDLFIFHFHPLRFSVFSPRSRFSFSWCRWFCFLILN
jgi:hypothetical protein